MSAWGDRTPPTHGEAGNVTGDAAGPTIGTPLCLVDRTVCPASTKDQRTGDPRKRAPTPWPKIRDDTERAREIGNLHRSGVLPVTSELLIDAEEDPALRAVLVGMIQDIQR